MSASNFKSMENFPLIVAPPATMCKICPDCGITCGEEETTCPDCGASLKDVEPIRDEIQEMETVKDMEETAKRLNANLLFHTVSVESGYYTGCQFYVDEKYCDISAMCNEETQDEFGMCRSKTLRKYASEGNFIRRELKKAEKSLGLWEIGITARFSNGETWYSKVA